MPGSHPLALITLLKTYDPLTSSDHKRDPSALDSQINKSHTHTHKKCSVIAAIVGFAHLAKRPHYWLTG